MSLQILHVLIEALHLQVTLLWTRQYMSQEILLIQAFHPQVAVLWTRQFMSQEILQVVIHLLVTSGLVSIGWDN